MSGPITRRPFRTDRAPLDYAPIASDDSGCERGDERKREPRADDESRPQPQDPKKFLARLLELFVQGFPERWRPFVFYATTCTFCAFAMAFGTLSIVEWHWIEIPIYRAHTASAEDFRDSNAKTNARVDSLDADVQDILTTLQIAEIKELRCYVEIMENVSPVVVNRLSEVLEKYRVRNGSYPPSFPCRRTPTK